MNATATVTNINQRRDMPSDNGYVNLWRDINKQEWSYEALPYALFTKLLTSVQHKPYIAELNGIKVPLQAGEYGISWAKIIDMFHEIKNISQARRLINRFKSLSQIYTREVKKGRVNYGFIIGFTGWEKWQNTDRPTDTPSDIPKAANLKALEGGRDRPADRPADRQRNNNDLNNIKESDRQANLTLLKSAYEHMWKKWKSCKLNIGKTDTSPKAKTFDKNFKSIFNQSYFNKNSQEAFRAEINQICKFKDKAHSIEGFNRFENMQLPKFLNEKQWRD